MWDRHPVRLAVIHMLPNMAEARGVTLAPMLARAGLSDWTTDRVVTRAQVSTVLQAVARQTGDPLIGLELAARADPLHLGLSGRALVGGRTLRESLSTHARHMPTLQAGVRLHLEIVGERALWHHVFLDSDASHASVLNEGVAAFVVQALRAIVGVDGNGIHVHLPHRPRAPVGVYEERLGAGLSFGKGAGLTVSFDAAWLDRPNVMFEGAVTLGHDAPADMNADGLDDAALLSALEAIVPTAALAGTLSLVDASRSLGLAPRTLQRRLATLGTSFAALVEDWRRVQSRRHLSDPTLSVAAVAHLLGYSDPAHFIRAFRRWERQAPTTWRRAAVARDGN